MKIIRPMKLGENNSTSNAPPDNVSDWAPVGRDLHQNVNAVSLRYAGSHLYAAFDDGKVYKITLSDGSEEVVLDSADHLVASQYMLDAVPSPDEQYIALVHHSGSTSWHSRVKVIELATNQEVFPASTGTDLRHVLFNQGRCRAFWSPDSTRFHAVIYADGGEDHVVKYADTSDWSYMGKTSTAQTVIAAAHPDPVGTSYFSDMDPVYKPDGSAFFIVAHTAETNHRVVLAEYNKERIRNQEKYLYINTEAPYGLLHNPTRGDLLIMGDSVRAFSDGNFSAKSLPVTFPKSNSFSMSLDDAELTIRTASVQPYLRRYSAADYTDAGDLDSILGATGNFMNYGPDHYIVGMDAGGYALVSYPGGLLIDQTNPDVIKGDVYRFDKRLYEVLVDNNVRPDAGVIADPPTWLDLGPVNRLRMFDGKLDTLTTASDSLIVDITPGVIVSGVALFNVDAETVRVTYNDPVEGLVYDTGEIGLLDDSSVDDWHDFFFDTYQRRSDVAFLDIPPFLDGTLTIELKNQGAISIGQVVLGSVYQLGEAQYGSSAGIIDFSRKEQDSFGNFVITPRRFSKRADYDVVIDATQGANAQRVLAQYRTTPVVWVGEEGREETIVYGYYRSFDVLLSNPAFSNVNISVEGL